MCEAFGCTPSEALEQDPALVFGILEYRLAAQAKAQVNKDASQLSEGEARMLTVLTDTMKEHQGTL